MARNIRYQRLGTVQRTANGGKAPAVELLRGVKTHALLFHVKADVTIAGAAGGAVNAEGLARLINSLFLKENGKPQFEMTGRALSFFTSRAQKQAANVDSLANASAQANTILRADFVMDFASIYGADPGETCYIEKDARFPTTLEFEFAADAQAALISGTGLTLNSLTIDVTQMYDPNSALMPFFLPRLKRLTSAAIVGTQASFRIPLLPESGNRVGGIVLHSVVDNVTNPSVLTGDVTIRGDKIRYLDAVPFRTLLNEMRRFRDGITPSAGYLELDFRTYGKLSEMYTASQDDNFRAELAATNPGTTATIDAYLMELEAVPGYTRDIPANW